MIKIQHIVWLLLLNIATLVSAQAQSVSPVSSKEAYAMLSAQKNWVVIDARTPEEFGAGHVKGAININIRQSDAYSQIDKLDPQKKYIVYCRTNHRSQIFVDYMKQKGFTHVFQITDGWTGWSANGLPVDK
jgi:rhodanese-related sulfurtransferase